MSIFRYSTTLVVVHWEGVQCTVYSVGHSLLGHIKVKLLTSIRLVCTFH